MCACVLIKINKAMHIEKIQDAKLIIIYYIYSTPYNIILYTHYNKLIFRLQTIVSADYSFRELLFRSYFLYENRTRGICILEYLNERKTTPNLIDSTHQQYSSLIILS